jgi:hypothetical protein
MMSKNYGHCKILFNLMISSCSVVLDDLVVIVLAIGPKFRELKNPTEDDGFEGR